MDAIADASSVTKRTLYYHFESKDALAAAVLDHQHAYALRYFEEWAKTSAKTPEAYLSSVFRRLGAWIAEPRWQGSGFSRLTMELADLPGHPVRAAARRHKVAVEEFLFRELKVRGARRPRLLARHALILMEGCMSLCLIHGDNGYVADATRAIRQHARATGR